MRSARPVRRARSRTLLALILVLAMVVAACGGDDDDGGGDDASPSTEQTGDTGDDGGDVELTDLGDGVTAESIKIGHVFVNYECIKDFIDFKRGDQEQTFQAFVDEMNENGGVLGRMIEPVYKTYCPIGNAEALEVCTAMTEDEEVFAVLGVFIDFSGDAQQCLTVDHETIHIGHELQRAWQLESPGLMLTPDVSAERRIEVLMRLVEEESYLEGKTVAIIADQNTENRVDDVIQPALDELGVDQGSTAVLTVTNEDTAAAESQLDSFIEKWKTEDVDALIISGALVGGARRFIEKIGAAFPDMLYLSDQPSGALQTARDMKTAGVDPNPYENLVSVEGLSASERWPSEKIQGCVEIYERRTGNTVTPPDEVVPDADGKRDELYTAVTDACNELSFFKTIAEKVGAELTDENWVATVDDFGPIEIMTSNFASLGEGKYDADDEFRLVQYDPTVGDSGDWKGITEPINTAEG